MENFDKATALTSKLAQQATAENKKKWVFDNLKNIESILDTGMSQKKYLGLLRDEAGLEMSEPLFRKYLSQARTARDSGKQTATAKKITVQPERVASPEGSDGQETPEPDWNEVEKRVGYRLSDEIRDYVSLNGKRVKENFPKGKLRSREARSELTILRRDLSRI